MPRALLCWIARLALLAAVAAVAAACEPPGSAATPAPTWTPVVTFTPAPEAAPDVITVEDPAGDAIDCLTGGPSQSPLAPHVDILRALAAPFGDPTRWTWVFPQEVDLEPLLSGRTAVLFGGLEFLDPAGETPPVDPTWFFNSQGNQAFNFGVDFGTGAMTTFQAAVVNGAWATVPGSPVVTLAGNELTLEVPLADVPAGASRILLTSTNLEVCDVVEIPVDAAQ